MSLTTTSRTLLATATGNWVSRIYLAVVAVVLVWAHVDAAFIAQADSSFVGIYAVLVTLPTGLLLLLVGAFSVLPFSVVVIAGALVNALLIGLTMRKIRGRR